MFALILPETEGKQLIDIENHFAGIKKLDNKVYRSKVISNIFWFYLFIKIKQKDKIMTHTLHNTIRNMHIICLNYWFTRHT